MQALRIAAVSAKTGLAEKTIRKWAYAQQFPKPFKLGSDVVVWDEADIDRWLQTKKQEKQHGSIGETQSI